MRRLGLSQRVVLVVGLGLALLIVGRAIARALARPYGAGWVGYMPLMRGQAVYGPATPHPWVVPAVHLVLLAIWIAGSLLILRRPAGTGTPPAAAPAAPPGAAVSGPASGPPS